MKISSFLGIITCLLGLLPHVILSQNHPNVVFIAIDDLNTWQGMMGHPYAQTPNIDRLAQQGVLFTQAHCQAPLCGPSRASLMSGLRPSSTGIYGQIQDRNLSKAHPILDQVQFLPEYFGQHGYLTMGIGKLFHQHAPEGVFEVSGGRVPGFGPKPPQPFKWSREGTSTDWGAYPNGDSLMPDYQSAAWAVERLQEQHGRPFFLAVGFLRPHVPWYVPPDWFELYPLSQDYTPPFRSGDQNDVPEIGRKVAEVPMMPTTEWAKENQEWNAICQAYLASISFVDAQVGKVLEALRTSRYAENTVVVLWSDHGYHLGEKNRFAKHSLWTPATQVPLIISGPGIRGERTSHRPVQLMDIYPTLLELCELPPNALNEGHSLVPLLKRPTMKWPFPAITTYGRGNHSYRLGNFRYTRYEDGSEELYDLKQDPHEWTNCIAKPLYKSVLKEFRKWDLNEGAPWSPFSEYKVNPYFIEQKAQAERDGR